MKYLSEKITDYVIKTGAASEESYAIYQYGFQIGLEMVSCFLLYSDMVAYDSGICSLYYCFYAVENLCRWFASE